MIKHRLQFRHNIAKGEYAINGVWKDRSAAMQYFKDITTDINIPDSTLTVETKERSVEFGESLYAEPMVTKYYDEDGKIQTIFAIGVDSGKTEYHIIDTKFIEEEIKTVSGITTENIERVDKDVAFVSGVVVTVSAITTEFSAATVNEIARLDGRVDDEINNRISADAILQAQITDNINKIVSVEPSSENVLEEYALKNATGETLGDHIKIYKDNSLVDSFIYWKGLANVRDYIEGEENVEPIITSTHKWVGIPFDENGIDKSAEYLYIVYLNAEGTYQLVGIDYENFLMESEFGDGLKVVEHIASIKIKNGEKYLSVSNDGLQTINIDEVINSASDVLDKKIDAEIERSSAADEYISALTASFSASVVTELNSVNAAIEEETKRAMEAEKAEMERAMAAEKAETERAIVAETILQEQITANKVNSKDIVVKTTEEGTNLTLQVDERTITKFASASTIYESSVSVLGSLLKVKQVTPTSKAVKSRFELQDGNGKIVGDPIEVMVESALVGIKQGRVGDAIDPITGNYITNGSGNTTMNFVYRLDNASYELAQVVIADYFNDAHFGRGLHNQDGFISLLEGDGNEFLVIGEDTIAVTGVTSAITIAKNEAETYADGRYNESISYTDNRYHESTGYTNSQISVVTSSIDELTNTMNSAIENVSNSLSSAINDVNNTLQTEITNRETADANILSQIDSLSQRMSDKDAELNGSINEEISNRVSGDTAIREEFSLKINDVISAYTNADTVLRNLIGEEYSGRTTADNNLKAELTDTINKVKEELTNSDNSIKDKLSTEINDRKVADTEINTKIDNSVSALTIAYTNADTKVLSDAKIYADSISENVLNSINTTKVRDVKYDKGNAKIYLEFSDNTTSEGFDASSFLIDGMIKDVNFDAASNSIKFIWNVDGGEKEVIISLSEFIDQYVIAEESKSYLKISTDNKISAIVDGVDNYSNTLATTNFVKNAVKTEVDTLSANTNNTINTLTEKHNTELIALSSNTQSSIDKLSENINSVDIKIVELSGATISHINENNVKLIDINTKIDSNQTDVNNTISALDTKIDNVKSGLESNIIILSGNCDTLIATLSGNTDSKITTVSGNIITYVDTLRSDVEKSISYVEIAHKNDIDVLSGNVHSTFSIFENNYRNEISAITTYIDNADVLLQNNIDTVSTKVDGLFNDREMPGSIPYVVERELDRALITDGIPITSTSIEDSDKIKSLIKEVIVGGNQSRYYVSADIKDFYYITEEGEFILSEYITSLHNRIKVLEDVVSNLDTTIKDTIKSYIVGTQHEIGLFDEETNLRIGFTDDAIFGKIE